MFKKWRKFLKKHNAAPEDSIPYRVAVTVLVMFTLVLTLHELEWPSYWPLILIITPSASLLSYHRRKLPNIGLKLFLSFAMMALLLWFFMRLSVTLYDPRLPLAELLIWLQTLHAFDLPAKKDLRYTGLVALILMALACVLTYNSYFAPLLILFCILFLIVLAIDFWSENRTTGTVVQRSDNRPSTNLDIGWVGKTVAFTFPLALLGAAVIFLFMPRYDGLKLRSLPMKWNMQFSLGQVSGGEIRNQGVENTQDSGGKPQRVDGDSYFGFDSEVNLNARGQLSNRVVMKVRTSNWQYHRGVTFSEYTGTGWKSIPWEPSPKTIEEPPFYFPPVNRRDERVTIYYAETDLPNVVFSPANPRRLYFPSNELYTINSFDPAVVPRQVRNLPATLVSPFYLETGLVYSVLNQAPEPGTNVLARLRIRQEDKPPAHLEPFLALPDSVTERTVEKARELTRGKETAWTKAAALSTYLQQNFTYDVDVPFYPEGADTVDHFLFESKLGYCEQFATSLVVLARSAGLPARYVTGFLPGTYNPVSGFYEIKASDAHAWAEIYMGEYGWMIFDPVPGGNATPQLGEPPGNRWLLESLLEYLNVPAGIRQALPDLLRILVGLAVVSLLFTVVGTKRRKKDGFSSHFAPYLRHAERLTEPRRAGETVKSWAERLHRHPQLQVLARIYEERFYQDLPLEVEQEHELREAVASLKRERSRRRKTQ